MCSQHRLDSTETNTPSRKNYEEYSRADYCSDCDAPCCRMLLIPYVAPTTFMEMDYIKYMLGFPGINLIFHRDGTWQIQVEQTCRHLESEKSTCALHDTPLKPKTCCYYNPFNCYYKRNYSRSRPQDLVRIDHEIFDALIAETEFDGEGNIVAIPPLDVIEAQKRDGQNTSPKKAP